MGLLPGTASRSRLVCSLAETAPSPLRGAVPAIKDTSMGCGWLDFCVMQLGMGPLMHALFAGLSPQLLTASRWDRRPRTSAEACAASRPGRAPCVRRVCGPLKPRRARRPSHRLSMILPLTLSCIPYLQSLCRWCRRIWGGLQMRCSLHSQCVSSHQGAAKMHMLASLSGRSKHCQTGMHSSSPQPVSRS